MLRLAALWSMLLLWAYPGAALAACTFGLGPVTANPASVTVGSTVAVSIPLDYAGCRNTTLTVSVNHPADVAYASCAAGGDWNCAGVSSSAGVTSSSLTPGNNGKRSGTLMLVFTASGAGTRAVDISGNPSGASQSVSFTVTRPASPPTVSTQAASGVTRTGATLNATVTSNGAATTVGFAYGTTTAYGQSATAQPSPLSDSAENTAVSATLTGLACGTTYHFRAQASNTAGTTNGSNAIFTTPPCLPSPTLEFLFNENAWSGAVGEVQDSSGNGHHGTASGLAGMKPTTAATSPAVGGNGNSGNSGNRGTCGYGVFNRANKEYVELPPAFPNLGASSSFTITAWIRTTNHVAGGQRIFADDQSNSRGFAVSLGDGGAGRLRFYQRGGGSSVIMDTGAVIASNTWYLVAAVADIAAKTRSLYVYDSSGALLASPSITYTTSSFGIDTGPASIGGETNAASERTSSFGFGGDIDELRVYPAALSPDQIDLVRGLVSECGASPPSGPDHYELSLPASSLACLPSKVTVTACADASSPCTSPDTSVSGASITLGTSAGTLAAGSLVFDGTGVASTTLSHAAAGDGDLARVTMSDASVAAANADQCCPDGVACSPRSHCDSRFGTAGFVIAGSANGAGATVPAQTAGASSGPWFLRALKTNTDTKACEAALVGASSVNWAYECNDPNVCATGNRLVIKGNGATAVAANANGAVSASTAVPMTFDADGNAPFGFSYADAGRVTLHASKPAGGTLLSALVGRSNAFVVKPAGFVLSHIKCSSYSPGACATAAIPSPGHNPAAASGSGAAFIPAGRSFTATVTAVDAMGNSVPNFGQESSPETVTLRPTLVAPAGGTDGTLSNPSGFGSFSGGAATGTAFAYSEVGIIALTPRLASGNYLGSGGAVAGTASGNVGRFIPDHFTTTLTHGCSARFTYSGQPFAASLSAHNAGGSLVANYGSAGFAKAVVLSDGHALGTGSFTAGGTVAAGAFNSGVAAATPTYTFTNKLTAPGTLALRATDTDGVSSAGHAEGSTGLRSGRLRLANGFGRESAPLQIVARAEYWTGASWLLNGDDDCTAVPAAAVALGHYRNHLGTSTAAWSTSASAVSVAAGSGLLTLSAPSPASTGSVALALNLGSSTADQSCTSGLPASTGAGLPWLRALNGACAASHDRDPAARASFGIYSPETRKTVHAREIF